MRNALSTPAAPDVNAQPQQSNAAPDAGAPMQVQAPAPTHGQTVAALRHFSAIGTQLEKALRDPGLGKSDIKSKVIDGMTTLVANRIIKPAEAVTQLSTFPEKPFDQRKWVEGHMQQVMQARDAVLDHHRQAFAGAPEEQIAAEPQAGPDDHLDTLQDMMQSHYGKR